MEIEIWKSINSFEGIYEISNLGRVKGLSRGVINKGFRIKKERFIKERLRGGYKAVGLWCNCIRIDKSIHRLIALHFIPNPENKTQINHINGVKTDNRIENLEWCTQSENRIHALNTGLCDNFKMIVSENMKKRTGSKNYKSKTVIDTISGEKYESITSAAKKNCLNIVTLHNYLNGVYPNKTNLKYL